jgi:hypothetical protein
LSINQFSFTQKIEPGKYVYEYGDNVKSIFEIINNSTFYLIEEFWHERFFGYGNYYIDRNKLTLKFNLIPHDKLVSLTIPEFRINKESISKKDYITINLNVMENWDSSKLEGVRINITDYSHNIIRNNISTDDSGFVKIKVSNRFLPIKIKAYFVAYDHLEFQISEIKDYSITVVLKSYISDFYKENELKKFEIQILDSSSFKLENYYSNFDWSTFYKE